MSEIVDRLLAACHGHPFAKVPWPHRLLHDTIKELRRQERIIFESYQAVGALQTALNLEDSPDMVRLLDVLAYGKTDDKIDLLPFPKEDLRVRLGGNTKSAKKPPSYHDLYITTIDIARTSIFNLPYAYFVTCFRTAGWELWKSGDGRSGVGALASSKLVAGEYDSNGLRLDINGYVICDSLKEEGDGNS